MSSLVSKVIDNYKNLKPIDFFRKSIYELFRRLNYPFFRKIKCAFYLKKFDINIGNGVKVFGLPIQINIGNNNSIYDNCIFEFSQQSLFKMGNNNLISYGVLVCCTNKIIIGDDVQIGEYTSIRDSTHSYFNPSIKIKGSPDIIGEIVIGNDVWIGRGCIILPNSKIGNRVVIGANSVVKGHLESNSMYAGCPAKLIKKI